LEILEGKFFFALLGLHIRLCYIGNRTMFREVSPQLRPLRFTTRVILVWDSRNVCFDSDIHFLTSRCKYTVEITMLLNVTANKRTMKIHFVVIANTLKMITPIQLCTTKIKSYFIHPQAQRVLSTKLYPLNGVVKRWVG